MCILVVDPMERALITEGSSKFIREVNNQFTEY
jgi:hypothetical protein